MSTAAQSSLESLGAPRPVAEAVGRLQEELMRAAGANFAGLILYGGVARGRYHAGRSDIDEVVLLHDVSIASLAAVAPALRAAWRAVRVEAMLLTPQEVAGVAAAFPTKFLDIRDHHVVLAGTDPFAGLQVPMEAVRLRIEQSLRNMVLRLRRRFLGIAKDEHGQEMALKGVARPLALELGALLRLTGQPTPAEDRTSALFADAARAFDLDGEALAHLARLRAGEKLGDLTNLYERVLQSITRAADRVAQMKEPTP